MSFYGACGVEGCSDCHPLFDEDNREIKAGELMRVEWDEANRHWFVYARNSVTDDWALLDGPDGEIDDLLSIARDIITGG